MRGFGVVLCLLAGCFQDPYDVDDYWSDLAKAHCNAMKSCCTRADYNDWWTDSSGNQYSCIAAHGAPGYAPDLRRDIADGTIVFDPVAAHACVRALERLSCSEFQPGIRYRETYCESPLRGQIPEGGACRYTDECADGYCLGVCHAFLAPGAACGDQPSDCKLPYKCQPDGRCGLGQPAGSSCQQDSECVGDWCKDDGIFSGGTCYQACQSGG
jgi:hypothetical protein